MTIHKSAFYPIEISPDLVSVLESKPFGYWPHYGEGYFVGVSYLTQEAKDGKINYGEGHDASRSYYELQKLIKNDPEKRKKFDQMSEPLRQELQELGEKLVTIVDEKNHIIKVHGVSIQIDGNPSNEELLAIGEGIRRHEPWLVKAIFSNERIKLKITYGPYSVWKGQLGNDFSSYSKTWKGESGSETGMGGLIIYRTDARRSPYVSKSDIFLLNSHPSLSALTSSSEHEFGHAIDLYLPLFLLQSAPREILSSLSNFWLLKADHFMNPLTFFLSDLSDRKLCRSNLQYEYGEKVLKALAPEKLNKYADTLMGTKKDSAEAQKILTEAVREKSTLLDRLERDPWFFYTRHSFRNHKEFFTDSYLAYHNPDFQAAFAVRNPEYYRVFSLLESLKLEPASKKVNEDSIDYMDPDDTMKKLLNSFYPSLCNNQSGDISGDMPFVK